MSVICDTPIVLRLPWEALPVGDGGLPLAQILSEPIAYSLPGAGVRPRRDVHHPNGGRLVIVSSGAEMRDGQGFRRLCPKTWRVRHKRSSTVPILPH